MAEKEEKKEESGITKVCRDRSPRLLVTKKKRTMARNGFRFRKIHRMDIQFTANCQIVETDSPNLLFAKFPTDITSNLQYRCPHLLTKSYIPEDGQSMVTDYVMAPTDEDTYSRARILKVVPDGERRGFYCLVVFIDFGNCAWLHSNCLVEIDSQFFYSPWQAFAFSLFGVRPLRRAEELIKEKKFRLTWTTEHLAILRDIIDQYDNFQIQSVIHLKDHVKEETLPYNLFGLIGDRKVDIALQFAAECNKVGLFVEIDRTAIVFDDFKEFRTKFNIEPKLDKKAIPAWRREISPIWGVTIQGTKDRETKSALDLPEHEYLTHPSKVFDRDFTPSEEQPSPLLSTFSNELLVKQYVDEEAMTSFVLLSTPKKTLNEFYVMPLKRSLREKHAEEEDYANAVEEAKAELKAFSNSMDAFYVESCNQRPVDPKITCTGIVNKVEQYAIYELPHNVDLVHGRYRRVMLVGLRLISEDHYDTNSWMVEVVYVDFGGCEWVPLSLLLRIHSKHCTQDTFAVQVYPQFTQLNSNSKDEHVMDCLNTIFNACVPVISILKGNLQEFSTEDMKLDFKTPYRRPNVLLLSHMEVEGSPYSIEDIIVDCAREVLSSGQLVDAMGNPRKLKITKCGGNIMFMPKYKTEDQRPSFVIEYEDPEDDDPETPTEDRAIRYFCTDTAAPQ